MKSAPLRPIAFGRPGEEIGAKELVAVIQRFKNLHKLQLQRIQSALTPRQRDFLVLLPLLVHVNHPLLPGFVDSETPAGIADYQPNHVTLQRAARLSRSFEYRRRALSTSPIQGLFLMGSVGSIAYTRKSDLDIWLCHDPALREDELCALRGKTQALEQWAATLNLEAHIFFIDQDKFRAGRGEALSSESCGSIQHHLLLEEFYRTSLFLAGRAPAWWLVPPGQDEHYRDFLDHLLGKRFIGAGEVIDFGGLEHVAPSEFLGGTLWHLYKAISAPHKSLLKLLLMECYAAEYPRPDWLCNQMKRAVYAGNVEISQLDAYILMYRKVEHYLRNRQEYERLDLAQQSFYLKINELLSVQSASVAEKHQRREIVRAIIDQWGWSRARLAELDTRGRCRIGQVLEAHQNIAHELTRAYQSVSRFAREHAHGMRLDTDEIILLGRRLYAALERKPGKVEHISQDIWDELVPEELLLRPSASADGGSGWELRAGRAVSTDPLKRARCLLEILAWLILNGFYHRNTSLALESDGSALGFANMRDCMQALDSFLRRYWAHQDTLEAYLVPPRIVASALFINLDALPEHQRTDGRVMTSNRYDPFSFGATRIGLIAGVDHLRLTSWEECTVERRQGLEGLFDAFCEILNDTADNAKAPPLECYSFDWAHSQSIRFRVQEVFADLTDRLQQAPETCHVVRGGPAFFLFERRLGRLHYRQAPDETALMAELARPRAVFAPVRFDRWALDASPLPLIHMHNREGVIQVFCRLDGACCEVFVLDERGSQFHHTHRDSTPAQLFAAYALFFSTIQHHTVITARGLEFFLLERGRNGAYQLQALGERPNLNGRKLSVRIHAVELRSGHVAFTIYCNDREFSSMQWGERVFSQAAEYILALRQSGERYPIHVTDIDAPPAMLGADDASDLQTVHFLNYKRKVEERLQV